MEQYIWTTELICLSNLRVVLLTERNSGANSTINVNKVLILSDIKKLKELHSR